MTEPKSPTTEEEVQNLQILLSNTITRLAHLRGSKQAIEVLKQEISTITSFTSPNCVMNKSVKSCAMISHPVRKIRSAINWLLRPKNNVPTVSSQYLNRICIPFDQDHFTEGMRRFLEGNDISFARVETRRTGDIYYFFRNLDETRKFVAEHDRFNCRAKD